MTEHRETEDPILNGPHWPVFFRYALPSVAGLLALTTANIVDGIFIGNYAGADALAALNLLIPYFTFLFGMALALAIGGTVRAGKYLGENRPAAASAIFSKCLMATFALALIGTLAGLVFHESLYRALGASADLFPLMSEYFLIIVWVMLLINWLLITSQGVTGVAAFTVVNYLIFLSLMVFYGISDAMHVLLSHNLGAGNAPRIRTFMGCGALVILGLGTVLVLIATFAPQWPPLVALPLAEWLTFALAVTLFLRFRPQRLVPQIHPAGAQAS